MPTSSGPQRRARQVRTLAQRPAETVLTHRRAHRRSTTQSTHWVSALTSSGSTADNIATQSWLRPSLRYGSVSTMPLARRIFATALASTSSEKSMVPTTCERNSGLATIRRWLSQDALKPWQYQSWIFITDPEVAVKAQRVLDLYDRTWGGKPLGAGDYVISADEKTSIQARCRCQPTLPAGKARQMRVNHEDRCGAVAYLAAYDVHRGKVFGRCENTTGIARSPTWSPKS